MCVFVVDQVTLCASWGTRSRKGTEQDGDEQGFDLRSPLLWAVRRTCENDTDLLIPKISEVLVKTLIFQAPIVVTRYIALMAFCVTLGCCQLTQPWVP